MTRDGDLKRLIRARMRQTGQRYTAARASLLRSGKEGSEMIPVTVEVRVQTLTEEEVERWTEQHPLVDVQDTEGNKVGSVLPELMAGRDQPWMILSEIDGKRRLPIACGAVEATSIAFALQGIKTHRPMTHDLLRDVVSVMGEAREVRVTELRGSTFFAELLVVDNAGEERTVSCRPSDGIALALRSNIPILVEETLFTTASAMLP